MSPDGCLELSLYQRDLLQEQWQVGSFTGTVHLSSDSTSVIRRAGETSNESKGKLHQLRYISF